MNLDTHFSTRSALIVLALASLTACSSAPTPPALPDGSSRVPVNRELMARKTDAAPIVATKKDSAPDRPSFVLEGVTGTGKSVRVSLLDTLTKIAANTGLRIQDNDVTDEHLVIIPSSDPFDVLRQLAQKSQYRISLDREKGRLWLSNESKKNGLFVLRDAQPVVQVGGPVTLTALPDRPTSLETALRLLAPKDFEIGYAETIDPNISVDMRQVKSWLTGLEAIALQTPYRVVFDWEKKFVYVVPVTQKGI